jgi:hypothetical protein
MAPMPVVDFVASTHRYYLGDRELPHVTGILKDAGLVDDRWFTEESRLRGQYVHLATHYLDDGDLVEDSIDPAYAPYLHAYGRFLELAQPEWTFVEWRVVDPLLGYAGTLDRAGVLMLTGTKTLIDIKTGSIPPWAGIQTAAYKRCLPEPHTWKRAVLNLKGDGSFALEDLTDRRDEARFLAALDLWQWKAEHLPHGTRG